MKLIFENDYIMAYDYLKNRFNLPYEKVYLAGNEMLGNIELEPKEILDKISPEAKAIYYLYEISYENNHFKEILRLGNIKLVIESFTSLNNIFVKEMKDILGVGFVYKDNNRFLSKLNELGYGISNNYITPRNGLFKFKYHSLNDYLVVWNPITIHVEEMMNERKKIKDILLEEANIK